MGDTGDYWRDVNEYRQQQRTKRRSEAPELLRRAGIKFSVRNDGAHILINNGEVRGHFWPGTGRWKIGDVEGFGIEKLLAHLNQENEREQEATK